MQGLQCLTWVAVKPAPRDFIENFVGASDFWGNKIRVQHRKTSPEQMAFVDNFKKLIVELMPYVKEYHTTGVAWNPQVGPACLSRRVCTTFLWSSACDTCNGMCVCTGRGH
jgi:adenylyl cyclase-associated protein